MAKVNWNSVIDNLQAALVWFVIGLITICVTVLILFDVIAGAGVMWVFTQGKTLYALLISFATTGLMMGLAFIGYTLQRSGLKAGGWVMFIFSIGVFVVDTYFDMLGADVLRHGVILAWNQIDNNQIIYRILIAGLSVMGEPMAISIILGMPVLKEMFTQALPPAQRYTQTQPVSQASLASRPIPRPNIPVNSNRPTSNNYTYHPIGTQRRDDDQ